LIATIKEKRSALLNHIPVEGTPIPKEMPKRFMEQYASKASIEDIGEPITACFLTGSNVDINGW